MKKIIKPIAAVAIAGITMFSCASTNDGYSSAGTTDTQDGTTTTGTMSDAGTTDTMEDEGTTTETSGTVGETETMDNAGTTGGTDTMGNTTDTTTETDVMNNADGMNTGTDPMANTDAASYDELFVDVDNTAQYGVLELARMDPRFSTFVQLVDMAGLAQSLEAAGPLTVFLPTNEAFQEMDKAEYDRLTDPQNKTELIRVINLHVLNTEIGANQFGTRQVIESADGTEIPVSATAGMGSTPTSPGVISVGGAEIVKSDVDVSNGVVHVVNRIITPENVTGPGVDR